MPTISATHSALFGIRENLRRFDETALRLARTAPAGDPARELVKLGLAEYGVRASVEVAKAADRLTGTLLDVIG